MGFGPWLPALPGRMNFGEFIFCDCVKTPDRSRTGTPPSAENGPTGLYFGVSCYRRPTSRASPTTFHTVSLSTRVNKALSPWVAITSAGKGGHAHERASTQDKTQGHARVGRGALLQQRDAHIVGYYTEGRPSPNWGVLRALGWGRAR